MELGITVAKILHVENKSGDEQESAPELASSQSTKSVVKPSPPKLAQFDVVISKLGFKTRFWE